MNLQNFDIDERVWALIEPLLPSQDALPQGGRPPLENYRALCGIIFRLRTGCQWKAVPRRFGSPSAIHKRFQEWIVGGIFEQVFAVFIRFYDVNKKIEWEWMSIDSASTKAPKGGTDTGRNPTDRGKKGSKRHILADSRGAPVAVETSAANTHDSRLVEAVIDNLPSDLSDSEERHDIHICLDKAYDSKKLEKELRDRGFVPHIRRRGEGQNIGCKKGKPRRWVVERTNSWHNRFRGLLIRWEHKGRNHRGLVLLASALMVFNMASGVTW